MLRDVIKVNIYFNPFDTKESYSFVFKENIRIEKILLDIYGKNFKNNYNFSKLYS